LEIQKSGHRGASLVRQLLTFSRRQVVEPKVLDLNETVGNMTAMLLRLIGEHIPFDIKKGENLFPIRADVNQVEQVIMNLVINACDAMPKGGNLSLQTSSIILEKPLPYQGGEIEPNRYTVLTVTDSGTGMNDEVKRKIFEPFFTTKPIGEGTGLGLATCFGIVQQAGGVIRCESELGHGTTFQVYLPAAGGNAQLAFVQSRSQLKIELLLSDIVMPNMSGVELMERLSRLRPEMKCLLVSGYTDEVLLQRGVADSHAGFLQKPFTNHQLSESVRAALDAA
jgi:two-component system cell cycle sensor histidine kinase/response regulator CckA